MLLHKNNKFIYNNVAAIKIPNNVYLDPCPDPCPIEGMVLYTEDKLAQLEINFIETDKSPRAFLEEGKECYESFLWLKPISAVVTNGLEGLTMSYATERYVYEEYALALPGSLLNVCIEQKKGCLTNHEKYVQLIAELLEGLERIME